MDIENLIGETTEYDKKAALEVKKPKSWCKSVSAFANTLGGALIFGMADDGQIVGLTERDSDAEKINEIIKTRMEPISEFRLRFHKTEDGKVLLILAVFKGEETSYYYSDDSTFESPIRWSRLFCTRWNGLDKSGGTMDALDDAGYSGSVLSLIENGEAFIKRNARMMWRKTPNSREELPEYVERSCHEAQINYRQLNRLSGSFVIDAHRERYRKHQHPQRALAARWGCLLRWFWVLFSGRAPLPASRLKGGLPSSAGRVRG